MNQRNGGDVVLEALSALGVERVFAVASVHNLPILEAIARDGSISVVNVRHEQSAVHAADGYARATGRLGVALTSTGPGAANAMGGLFEAAFASSPVLMITGQIESRFIGHGRGYLHEAEHQREMLRSLVRECVSVRRVEDIGESVVAAGRSALTGRRAPIAVEIPIDLQYAAADRPCPSPAPIVPTLPQPDRLQQAAELLGAATRPLIWAGGGVVGGDAGDALERLAETLRIPVVTTVQGRGAIPEDHELCLGALATMQPLRGVVESADVVLAVGTRFQMYATASWTLDMPQNLIHIDVDPSVIGRTYAPAVTVVSDARAALEGLIERVSATAAADDWEAEARQAAANARAKALEAIGPDHRSFMDTIRRHLPPAGAVVRDATVPAYNWGDRLLPILQARTSINPASAAIGPGLPLALGATIGRGARSVVIHGDGGIMLTIGELATLAQFDVPLTVCVFNDRGYGILRKIQAAKFDGARHDVDLATPDFVGLAESMGLPAVRVTDSEGFEKAFAASVEAEGPYLIEVDLAAVQPMRTPT